MNSNNVLRALALAASALFLSACGTFNGYTSATAEDAERVAKGEYSPAAMAQAALVQHPLINGGIIPAGALQRIQENAISCQWQLDPQLAGVGQSMLGGGSAYGAAGAVGTGLGAKEAFGSAVSGAKYGIYGGIAMFFSGAVNGATSGSYAADAAKGDCLKQMWAVDQAKNPKYAGTFVVIVYYGKSPNSRPPALDRSVTSPLPAVAKSK